ncbi:hypothetical protein DNTS_016303 [Danionella cerebrum]|uniref:Uncharacterized protein n=1 Tax=Danionella cerebrum TaxID=2873325 RepID=A0A553RJ25_9TELE|nr:hypothetical protein DNTS_016303 [Danionella translucida]
MRQRTNLQDCYWKCSPETERQTKTQPFTKKSSVLFCYEHEWATFASKMISHYPLTSLLPWPPIPHLLDLEGEGGVSLQRYQPRSPETSPPFWVSRLHLC